MTQNVIQIQSTVTITSRDIPYWSVKVISASLLGSSYHHLPPHVQSVLFFPCLDEFCGMLQLLNPPLDCDDISNCICVLCYIYFNGDMFTMKHSVILRLRVCVLDKRKYWCGGNFYSGSSTVVSCVLM